MFLPNAYGLAELPIRDYASGRWVNKRGENPHPLGNGAAS
jgi:hypothetical protein